jgi:hypothetical protein
VVVTSLTALVIRARWSIFASAIGLTVCLRFCIIAPRKSYQVLIMRGSGSRLGVTLL